MPLWLSAAALGFLGAGGQAADVSAFWTGASDDWSTAGNWVPSTFAPNNGNGGLTYDAIIGSGTATLSEAISIQNLSLVGGSISGDFDLTVNGLLSIGAGGGTISGAGALAASGGFNVQGSFGLNQRTLTSSATATVAAGGSISANGVTFNNNSTLNLNNTINGQGGTVVNNSGVVDIKGDVTAFNDYGGGAGNLAVNNTGTIRKSTGAGTASINAAVDNTLGTVNAQSGTIAFNSGGVIAGTYQNTSGAGAVRFNAGTFTLGAATFSGDDIGLGGGELQLSSAVNLVGLRLVGGNVTGTFSTTGTTSWEGSSLGGTYQNNGTVNWTGSSSLIGGTLNNAGTLNLTTPVYGQTAAVVNNSGTVNLQADNYAFHDSGGGAGFLSVNNTGTIQKTTGAGTAIIQAPLSNQAAGVVDIQSGAIQFAGTVANSGLIKVGGIGATLSSTFSQTASGVIELAGGTLSTSGTVTLAAGTLKGSGTISGTVINGGALQPGATGAAGTVDVTGNLFQSGGSMTFGVGGSTPGTEHDQVTVGGTAFLSGSFSVKMENGFHVTAHSVGPLILMDAASDITGAFGNAPSGSRIGDLDGFGSWLIQYGPSSLLDGDKVMLSEFVPVPEPWQHALVSAVGLSAFGLWRRSANRRVAVAASSPSGR